MYITSIILLVGLLAFGLGRLSVIYGGTGEIQIEYPEDQQASVHSALSSLNSDLPRDSGQMPGGYVASKTGSKYFLPWCGGAQSINPSNKIYFKTKEEAEARGYTPAGNCKGISSP